MATPLGVLLFALGLAAFYRRAAAIADTARTFFSLWLVAGVGYVLIFFLLNVMHNYYQLPLLAPIALGIGLGLEEVRRLAARFQPRLENAAVALVFVFLALWGWGYAESQYYRPPWEIIAAGQVLQAHTPPNSLVAFAQEATDCRDPRGLYYAQRYGWSVALKDVTPEVLRSLRGLGAEYLVIIHPSELVGKEFLPAPVLTTPLTTVPWKLWLFRLTDAGPAAKPQPETAYKSPDGSPGQTARFSPTR
jgi:hypothetical protein